MWDRHNARGLRRDDEPARVGHPSISLSPLRLSYGSPGYGPAVSSRTSRSRSVMLPVMVADMGAGRRPRQARPIDLLVGRKLEWVRLGHAIALGFSGGRQGV